MKVRFNRIIRDRENIAVIARRGDIGEVIKYIPRLPGDTKKLYDIAVNGTTCLAFSTEFEEIEADGNSTLE